MIVTTNTTLSLQDVLEYISSEILEAFNNNKHSAYSSDNTKILAINNTIILKNDYLSNRNLVVEIKFRPIREANSYDTLYISLHNVSLQQSSLSFSIEITDSQYNTENVTGNNNGYCHLYKNALYLECKLITIIIRTVNVFTAMFLISKKLLIIFVCTFNFFINYR